MLLLLLPLCTLCSQEAYMGQIQVTRRSFSLSGNQLHIQMDVNYEGLQMPSDESLTLTPRLQADDQAFSLPSILINGTEKSKVYERARVLGGNSGRHNGDKSTPSVVLKTIIKPRAGSRTRSPFRSENGWRRPTLCCTPKNAAATVRRPESTTTRLLRASCCPK